METLTKLFGSQAKTKMIKLFAFNPGEVFDIEQIADRTKENSKKVRSAVSQLQQMGLIRSRSFFKKVEKNVRKKKVTKKVRTSGWVLNEKFEFLTPLRTFLVNVNHLSPKDIAQKLQKVGAVKLVVISGIFTHDTESRVDLLIVGDNIKKNTVEHTIKTIESEIGVEIRYACFETADFKYRLGLYDKLIRDILDFPHEKIVNKLGVI